MQKIFFAKAKDKKLEKYLQKQAEILLVWKKYCIFVFKPESRFALNPNLTVPIYPNK